MSSTLDRLSASQGLPCALRAAPCASLGPRSASLCFAGASQGQFRASLGPRRGRSAHRCGLPGAVMRIEISIRGLWSFVCSSSLERLSASQGLPCALRAVPCESLGPRSASVRFAGASQGPFCASLGPRKGRSPHRWGLARFALRIAGASQKSLCTSLRPRRSEESDRLPEEARMDGP